MMGVKDLDILKHILLKEEETETLPQGFEEDPMGFILNKYPGLNNVMEYMMTDSFREYVDAIFIVAPKPTTFKVFLHNGQYFFLQFMGEAYQATVQGKNYYLMSIGEKERCMMAISRLLRYGSPMKTKGPEGGEQAAGAEAPAAETPPAETGGEEAAGGEETLTEIRILQEILKKKLNEDSDTESGKDTKKYEIAATNKLNSQIQSILENDPEGKKSITIVVNGEEYPDIVRAEVVKGSQNKSDIDLVDSNGKHLIFISHKDAGGPKRFARWGSLQDLFKKGDKEVLNFRENIYSYIKSFSGLGVSLGNAIVNKDNKIVFYSSAAFSQKISSEILKNKIVFGKDFTEGKYTLNNVQLVVQGDIVLKELSEKPGFYEFDVNGAERIWFNGETPTGEYEPVLHAHWRGESSNELDITNCETMAKPIASVSGILWKAGETLNPEDRYLPKDAIVVPKDQRMLVKNEDTGEREIFVSKKWQDSFMKKMKDRHQKPTEYKKYFDAGYKAPDGYVRVEPSFRKDFYFSL